MNTGISLQQLVEKVDAAYLKQKDLLVPASKMEMMVVAKRPIIDIEGHAFVEPTEWAHGQIATHLRIPKTYYDRMAGEDPHLLAENVNTWMEKDNSTRMVRLEDEHMRAFLSDRYKRVDNTLVLRHSLEALNEITEPFHVMSSELTTSRLHMKVLFNERSIEVKQGRTIYPGVYISNSEVGGGSFTVTGFFYDSFCTNGCVFGMDIIADASMKRRHVGPRLINDGDSLNIYQEDTNQAEAEFIAKKGRDIIAAFTDEKTTNKIAKIVQTAAQSEEVENPEKAIAVLAKEVRLSDSERSKALVNLIEDKDYTKFGLASAVTKIANTTESYDRATELETLGSQIMTMQLAQFNKIKVAA